MSTGQNRGFRDVCSISSCEQKLSAATTTTTDSTTASTKRLPPNNSLFPSVLRLRTLGGAVGVEQLFELRSPKVQQRLRRAFATQAHRQHRFNVRKICPGHNEMCQNSFFSHQNVQKTNFFKLVCHVSLQPEALQRLPQRRGAGHVCHGQTLDRPPQICEKKHAGSHGHCSTSSPRGKNIASGPPNSIICLLGNTGIRMAMYSSLFINQLHIQMKTLLKNDERYEDTLFPPIWVSACNFDTRCQWTGQRWRRTQ